MAASSLNRRRLLCLVLGMLMLGAGIPAGQYASANVRLAYDTSVEPCLPYRLYWLTLNAPLPKRGEFAAFRVHGLEPLYKDGKVFTKLVAGVPGDTVRIVDGYVEVAGQPLGGIAPRVLRYLRKPPEAFNKTYVLGPGQYFMAGTEGTPYDSRYYGPVDAGQFIAKAQPLW